MQRNDLTPLEFRNVWMTDLDAATPVQPWLWQGYLAPGAVTLLTSPWKAGKTTLISALLNRLATGGELTGLTVRPGKAVIVSEESVALWQQRKQKFGFGPHVCWICRPFRGRPRQHDWISLMLHLLDLRREHQIDLAAIDPLAEFLPVRSESDAGGVLNALKPLQELTAAGLSVLLAHHARKHGKPDSRWARGSGAFSAFADILIEMDYHGDPADPDRRRRLTAYSRFDETPRCRVIELTETGTDYRSLGDFEEAAFAGGWATLQGILDEATRKLTRKEIVALWPAERPRPDPATVWRWLDRAVADGLVRHEGEGTRRSPYRYWNEELEEKWELDPLLRLEAESEDAKRQLRGGTE
jgi:hypothetical protein